MKKFNKSVLATAVVKSFILCLMITPAYAQEEPASSGAKTEQSRTLEVIEVTAQKRVESVNDVPVTVAAFNGEMLKAAGITNLQDLSISVPGLYVTESFVGDSMFIRGIGSGQNNLGFEQAVGQVVDGIFYGRSRFSRLAFLDVERVEVLKGPQGALIGKNTTAGAINTTTSSIYEDFETSITSTYEMQANKGYTLEGTMMGGLTDNLRARVAVRYDDRDGYLKNTSTGQDDSGAEDLVARIGLVWDASDDLEVKFQYQYAKIDHRGGNNQYSYCDTTTDQSPQPGFQNFTGLFNGIAPDDCTANYTRTGTAKKDGINVEGKQTNIDTYALTVNWDIGDYTFTSLTGYAGYDYTDLQDGDRTDVEGTLPEFGEDYQQFTQEFRIMSPLGDDYDYIAGLYFMDKQQDTDYLVHFKPFNATRSVFTHEEGRSYAAFGQFTMHMNEQWDLTLGGRYTKEEKQATNTQLPTELYGITPSSCMIPAAGVCFRHDVSAKIDEDDFSPVVNLQYRPDGKTMLYASVRRGFKAGGFDHLLVANSNDADTMDRFKFDSEDVTSYELGGKFTLADGSAQLNAAIYRSEFNDLQLGGFLNSTDVINTVTNAGSAISQGIEFDFRWRATERLTLFTTAAYLDSSYDDYKSAPCYTLQTSESGCVNGRQDLTGQKLQFASNWKLSASAEYFWNISGDYELQGNVQLAYVDEFPLQADLDPKLVEDGYTKIDARLTLVPNQGNWQVSLIARNLTDELSTNYGDDVPGQAGTVWRSVDAPRSIALQGVYRY